MGYRVAITTLMFVTACSTATRRSVVRVPVVVDEPGGWVEADGVRYATPAVVPVANAGAPTQLLVGSAFHRAQRFTIPTEFQWNSLWLGPAGVLVDMATGAAWQISDRDMVRVDLSHSKVRMVPAPYLASSPYRRATRLRTFGKALVIVGVLAANVGNMLVLSAACYEECDPGMPRRLTTGILLEGVALAAIVGGAIAWYKGGKGRERVRRQYLAAPRW